MLVKQIAANDVESTQQIVVAAAMVVLVTADVDADEDLEGVMEESAEVI